MSNKPTNVTSEQRASLMKAAMQGNLTDSDVKTAVEMGKSLSKSPEDKEPGNITVKQDVNND